MEGMGTALGKMVRKGLSKKAAFGTSPEGREGVTHEVLRKYFQAALPSAEVLSREDSQGQCGWNIMNEGELARNDAR